MSIILSNFSPYISSPHHHFPLTTTQNRWRRHCGHHHEHLDGHRQCALFSGWQSHCGARCQDCCQSGSVLRAQKVQEWVLVFAFSFWFFYLSDDANSVQATERVCNSFCRRIVCESIPPFVFLLTRSFIFLHFRSDEAARGGSGAHVQSQHRWDPCHPGEDTGKFSLFSAIEQVLVMLPWLKISEQAVLLHLTYFLSSRAQILHFSFYYFVL